MQSYNNNYKPSGKRFTQEQQPRDQRPSNNYYGQPREQEQAYPKQRYAQEQPRDQGRPYDKPSNYGGDNYYQNNKGYNNENR